MENYSTLDIVMVVIVILAIGLVTFVVYFILAWANENPNELHKHKCKRCGHIWEHANSCAGNREAHTCKCRKHTIIKYTEPTKELADTSLALKV